MIPKSNEFRVSLIYSSLYRIDLDGLEESHPFDIGKLSRIFKKLVDSGLIAESTPREPAALSDEEILSVHTVNFLSSLDDPRFVASYLESYVVAYLSQSDVRERIVEPFRFIAGGTIQAVHAALNCGIGINIGGGFHHAKPEKGEGFCIFADIPIAVHSLRRHHGDVRTLIIDLDVHQGNGLAVCHENDDYVFIFSMHQRDIYPFPKERCDLDVELSAGTGDEEYLHLLNENLPEVFRKSQPDIVFYVAGCDTAAEDPLASLMMTPRGITTRDLMIIDYCADLHIPVIMTLGGGYSSHAWEIQYETIRRIIEKYGLCSQAGRAPT